MATSPQNQRDIVQLRSELEGVKRKVLMQDIKINGLLKKMAIMSDGEPVEVKTSPTAIVIDEPVIEPAPEPPAEEPAETEAGKYDAMEVDELKALADERKLDYHSQNGAKKLRVILEEADEAKAEKGDENGGPNPQAF